MLKRSGITVFLFLPLLMAAQVTVNVQLPPAGILQKDQLWNMVVVNNGNNMIETTISIDLRDAVTGQTVLSGGSRSFTLGKGVKVIGIRDVQPVLYNYQASEFTGRFIPLGAYVACYRVFRNDSGEEPEPLADECVQVNINPLSPPLLATPADKAVLPTVYPAFSWLPPSPVEMFSSLNYEIAVVEVFPGQSPAEAVLSNPPVYTGHNLKTPYHVYPSGFSKLREGQQYAWQVTARNELNYAAQTEAWSFTIHPGDSIKKVLSNTFYILLRGRDQSGINYPGDKNLYVKYYSFDKAHETIVRFYAADNTLVSEVKQAIAYGDNFLRFALGKQFRTGEVYSMQLTDQQHTIHSVRFSIK